MPDTNGVLWPAHAQLFVDDAPYLKHAAKPRIDPAKVPSRIPAHSILIVVAYRFISHIRHYISYLWHISYYNTNIDPPKVHISVPQAGRQATRRLCQGPI